MFGNSTFEPFSSNVLRYIYSVLTLPSFVTRLAIGADPSFGLIGLIELVRELPSLAGRTLKLA
jgi:hypothetical protein